MKPWLKAICAAVIVVYLTSMGWAIKMAHEDWKHTANATQVVYDDFGRRFSVGNVGNYNCQAGITLTEVPRRCAVESVETDYALGERLRSAGSFFKWHLFIIVFSIVVVMCFTQGEPVEGYTTLKEGEHP